MKQTKAVNDHFSALPVQLREHVTDKLKDPRDLARVAAVSNAAFEAVLRTMPTTKSRITELTRDVRAVLFWLRKHGRAAFHITRGPFVDLSMKLRITFHTADGNFETCAHMSEEGALVFTYDRGEETTIASWPQYNAAVLEWCQLTARSEWFPDQGVTFDVCVHEEHGWLSEMLLYNPSSGIMTTNHIDDHTTTQIDVHLFHAFAALMGNALKSWVRYKKAAMPRA